MKRCRELFDLIIKWRMSVECFLLGRVLIGPGHRYLSVLMRHELFSSIKLFESFVFYHHNSQHSTDFPFENVLLLRNSPFSLCSTPVFGGAFLPLLSFVSHFRGIRKKLIRRRSEKRKSQLMQVKTLVNDINGLPGLSGYLKVHGNASLINDPNGSLISILL